MGEVKTINEMRVIINADDLGISPEVNESTFRLMEAGFVKSATLIPNGAYVEEASKSVGRFPHYSFGVHLNVAQFHPLTHTPGLERLLDCHGTFEINIIRRVSVDAYLKNVVFDEFCAQIERLYSLGVSVSHIDSHNHVHTIPWVLPVLKKVQRRFDIQKVRIRANLHPYHQNVSGLSRLKIAAYNFLLRHYHRTTTTQGFANFETFHECLAANRVKHRTVEVMVHPGSLEYNHADEIELLRTTWQDVANCPIRLISYHELQ